ncbi:MAG: hypothetical protein R3B70_28970 [Polyangiaceae bacterium]
MSLSACSSAEVPIANPEAAPAERGTELIQFDEGSYDLTKSEEVVGTFYSYGGKELWVLGTGSGKISCDDKHCDVSDIPISARPPAETCTDWVKHARELAEPAIFLATSRQTTAQCGPSCTIDEGTEHSFSMFSAGRLKTGSGQQRVFVTRDVSGAHRETWGMMSPIGRDGGTLSPDSSNSTIREFLCEACTGTTETLHVFEVTYTPKKILDCADIGLGPDAGSP